MTAIVGVDADTYALFAADRRVSPRRTGRPKKSGTCPLPGCRHDSDDGMPCPECREALGDNWRPA